MTTAQGGELTVRGESVQRLYAFYINDRFRVNRRYQRKLVWSVEEKQRLIDSLLKDLPIPLFLVAEIGQPGDVSFELIDGMQRLNAIFAFLENEFSIGGEYFDLDSLADTKLRKDKKEISQKTPVISRELSVQLANYTVALSVYRPASSASVDEVFRRINSGGRRLSRQGLRQAGTLSPLADLVRVISSEVRGDTSPSDVVALRTMPKLSITNRNLDYGVQVDDIFWVREGVLRREDVRESTDEQLVLDILIDCFIDPIPNSGTRLRDEYYNYTDIDPEEGETKASRLVNSAIEAYGAERIKNHFMRTYDALRSVLAQQEKKFSGLINTSSGGRSPRYFHAVFMAFYELMFKEGSYLVNPKLASERLQGVGSSVMAVPGGGGDWRRDSKRQTINAVKGVMGDAFEEGSSSSQDLGRYGWASQLERLLGNALVEQQTFDCKQGFLRLDSSRKFDSESFGKICRTITAIANMGSGVTGYVAIGIADNERAARRVEMLDATETVMCRDFHVVGIERESALLGKSLNDYWTWICQLLQTNGLDADLARRVSAESKLVQYQGRIVALLKVSAGSTPYFHKGEMVERSGSETLTVATSDYLRVYQRFLS
ncbi:DUF262 domain-containing protein [Streptomyces sp. SID2119]|uniref:GmrSD restriction endonuclease domain-containing protein n=2 Tax=Streptomyces sp. SID2119 TaxID=2690253 RepID=UPI00136BC2A2|nr:DUF262 domain-containing protein [Streptomyces sp. SID2119]MYW34769.1 DUF262 domain-containing protein [Streptomyces sp. SID2119]